ncbi:MAG: hypothetical protein ACP5OA_05675 [Candidatus Woesearchaeota archaeon]
MFKKCYKGQLSQTAALILILVGAIVMFLFISKVTSKSTFDDAINTCRFSVMTQVASEVSPGITGKKSPFDINCEKRYVKFYNTKVELGLNPENMKPLAIDFNGQKIKKFKTLTDQAVDQVIAEELRICKFQFAEGKVEVFANDDAFFGKNVCFICSEISFESSSIKQNSFNTLFEYTSKTAFDDTGTSYYEYLNEESYTLNKMWVQPNYDPSKESRYMINSFFRTRNQAQNYGNLNIEISKKYYVFFEKYEPGRTITLNEDANNVVTGEIDEVEQYWVAIVPSDEIENYCDFQAS